MKDRFGTVSKFVVVLLLSVFVGYGLTLVMDNVFDRSVGDWFSGNFIEYYGWSDGTYKTYSETLNWPKLKSVISAFAVGVFALFILTAVIFYTIGRRLNTKKVARDTAKYIRDYMILGDGNGNIPKEHEEILQYLTEIKKQSQDKERLILEEVNKKNDLIAYLAHDLKTPLTSVVGYLSLLEEVPELPVAQRAKYVNIALDKALRLETLINEFFDITRYNLHEIVLDKENIDLSYMLNQLTDEFYPILQTKGNAVIVDSKDDITVYADPVKLARVFNNILKNAISYSYANTSITISTGISGGDVYISFSNSGKTISKEKLTAIFEKFYRLDDARSSNTGGAGLGLAIAKEIVSQHGGSIVATSENETTTFVVKIPRRT